jgi:hypothetical protein
MVAVRTDKVIGILRPLEFTGIAAESFCSC